MATQTALIQDEVIMKSGLDNFKVFLAKEELKNSGDEFYWRLAFWKQINEVSPQITFFEKSQNLDSGYLSHSWHSFPAKFYPQLVRALINICKVKSGSVIFDPYAGCGTTLVESKLMGFDAVGTDISKLAILITKVKTNLNISTNTLEKTLRNIRSNFVQKHNDKNIMHEHTDFESHWYNSNNLRQLKILKLEIDNIKYAEIREFFLVALSAALRRIANTKSGQIEVRYKLRNKTENLIRLFENKVYTMISDLITYKQHVPNTAESKTSIYFADASKNKLQNESVDFIITSPPYGNGLDYSKIHKLSIALIFGEEELEHFKNSQTGTLYSNDFNNVSVPFSKTGQIIINKLKRISASRCRSMARYYWDMHSSIKNMYSVLKYGKTCVIIVGGTKIKNLEINNSVVLLEIANYFGFKTKNVLNWCYDKTRRSGLVHKIKGETILILEK